MSPPAVYIVTGTTRGIGKALAASLADRGHRLYTLSREPDHRDSERVDLYCDLRYPDQRETAMAAILDEIAEVPCEDVVLINNAGVLSPIAPIEAVSTGQMDAHMQVNLLAPLHLMALFIAKTDLCAGQRRVINMVSGAARHPYAGWALYCSAKAALLMATRCVALEHHRRAQAVSLCAVAPGVVATDMQATIRAADEADFPQRTKFEKLQAEGRLMDPAKVAALLLDLDRSGQFHSGGFYDLRDAVVTEEGPMIQPRMGE